MKMINAAKKENFFVEDSFVLSIPLFIIFCLKGKDLFLFRGSAIQHQRVRYRVRHSQREKLLQLERHHLKFEIKQDLFFMYDFMNRTNLVCSQNIDQ